MLNENGVFVLRTNLRNDHDGIRAPHFSLRRSESLAHQAFDAVTLYAFSVSFPDGYPHTHLVRGVVYHRQRGGKGAFSLLKKPIEIRLFFYS